MKGLIIYKGKYGATRQYSEWLREELNFPIVDLKNCEKKLVPTNLLILGSSVYIGKLELTNWLHTYVDLIKGKQIILFIVCGTPVHEKQKLESYIQSSVPVEIRNKCHIYFLPGRLIYRKLSLKDKIMLKIGAMLNKDPNTKKSMLTDYDKVKIENLDELIGYISKIRENQKIVDPA
jgi:menaquinone-dependent protoporphyrinogen IX oxidase